MSPTGNRTIRALWMASLAGGLMILSGCHQIHKARSRQLARSSQEHYAKGDFDKALEISAVAIRLGAESSVLPVLHAMRGSIFMSQRRPEDALKEFDLGLAAADTAAAEGKWVAPELIAEQLALRGNALEILGRYREALESFQKSVEHHEAHASAHNNIAWILATIPLDSLRDGPKAVLHATKACDLTEWKNAAFLDTLAAAHAENGDFENAVKWQSAARKFLDETDAFNIRGFESRLMLYRESKPYREEPRALQAEMAEGEPDSGAHPKQ